MAKIEPALLEQYWNQKYKRGAVIRFLMQCDDPGRDTRYKFGLVLNKDLSDSDALLALGTSNIERYSDARFEADIVRISSGAYPWVTVPTIFNLRQLKQVSILDLKVLLSEQKLEFQDEFSNQDLTILDAKIRASRIIELRIKRRVLPDAI